MKAVSREHVHRLVLAVDVVNSELAQLMKQPATAWEDGSCRLLTQLRERLTHGCALTATLERKLLDGE